MLWQRILTGVIGVPFILWAVWDGKAVFLLFIEGLLGVGLWEFRSLAAHRGVNLSLPVFLIGGLSLPILAYTGQGWPLILAVILVVSLWEITRYIFTGKGSPLSQASFASFGLLYVGGTLLLLLSLRGMSLPAAYLAFLAAWINDTAAYFVGVTLGRHKLAPLVSPKKSIEGALGALLGSILLAWAARSFFGWTILQTVLFGVVSSLAAQLGDLLESAMKRDAGVKDSGWILLGHGGVLDRFDSLFLVIPVVYGFIWWMIGA